MKNEDKRPSDSDIEQQREDIRANITLLSGWQQAHANKSENFVYGMAGQAFAMHVRPGTKGWLILGDLIAAEIEQAGADLIMLGDA